MANARTRKEESSVGDVVQKIKRVAHKAGDVAADTTQKVVDQVKDVAHPDEYKSARTTSRTASKSAAATSGAQHKTARTTRRGAHKADTTTSKVEHKTRSTASKAGSKKARVAYGTAQPLSHGYARPSWSREHSGQRWSMASASHHCTPCGEITSASKAQPCFSRK